MCIDRHDVSSRLKSKLESAAPKTTPLAGKNVSSLESENENRFHITYRILFSWLCLESPHTLSNEIPFPASHIEPIFMKIDLKRNSLLWAADVASRINSSSEFPFRIDSHVLNSKPLWMRDEIFLAATGDRKKAPSEFNYDINIQFVCAERRGEKMNVKFD